MRTPAVIVALSLAAAFLVVAACTAEPTATEPGAAQGERSGPCYPNGTCNEGLVCDDVSNRCVRASGGADGGGDDAGLPTDTTDAAAEDAGVDAANACAVTIPPKDPNGFRCPNDATCDVGCCAGASSATCSELACEPDEAAFQCEAPDTCFDDVSVCCGTLVPRVGGACTNVYDVLPQQRVACRSVCDTSTEKPLCRTQTDCPQGLRCEPSRVFLAGNAKAMNVGVCVP